MHIFLSPVTVSEATLHMWLALIPPQDESAVKRLRAELRERSDRVRVVFTDPVGPFVGFVVEVDPPGATIWPPRLRAGLDETERQLALHKAAAYATETCKSNGLSYLECTLKGSTDIELAWRDAMLLEGFVLVARKCHYECDEITDAHLRGDGLRPTVAEVDPNDERIGPLFAQTLEDSLDRSTVFEGRHGGWVGDADHILIASNEGRETGICTLEHKAGSTRGWIKYVGTVPAARRSGIASELLAAGLRCLANNGAAVAECLIDVENSPSISLHDRFGFRATGACGDSYYSSLTTPTLTPR